MTAPSDRPTRRGPKISKNMADKRRAEVRRALARMEFVPDIAARLAAEWGISERMIYVYITQVREQAVEEMRARGENQRMQDAREIVDGLRDVVMNARAKKDYKTASIAYRELAKITGAYAPERLEVTGAAGVPLLPTIDMSKVPDEKLEALLPVLRALAGNAAPAPALTDGGSAAIVIDDPGHARDPRRTGGG